MTKKERTIKSHGKDNSVEMKLSQKGIVNFWLIKFSISLYCIKMKQLAKKTMAINLKGSPLLELKLQDREVKGLICFSMFFFSVANIWSF